MSNEKQTAYGAESAEAAMVDASFLIHEIKRLKNYCPFISWAENEVSAHVDTTNQSFPRMTLIIKLAGIKLKKAQ